jgi:uncharacterized membrane protein
MLRIIFAALFLFVGTACFAQSEAEFDSYMEILRSDIKTQRVALITQAMEFSDEEAKAFWPLYREYELELYKNGDKLIALIKDYAANFDTMTDEKALEIMNASFKIKEEQIKLNKKYFKQFDKVLPTKTVARFFQLNNQISDLLELQVLSELPLIE